MSIDLLTGLKLLGRRFIDPELGAVAGGGEDSRVERGSGLALIHRCLDRRSPGIKPLRGG